jgi:hypothetical protein
VHWYGDSLLTQALGIGETLVTPVLYATRVYYLTSVNSLGCESLARWDTVFVGPQQALDASPVQLLLPEDTIGLSAAETISVVILNYGFQAFSNFTISCSIDDNTAFTETVTDTILPGDNLLYTFQQTVDMQLGGLYHFKIWTTLPGDNFHMNDTLYRTVNNDYLVYIDVLQGEDAAFWENLSPFNNKISLSPNPAGNIPAKIHPFAVGRYAGKFFTNG